MRLRIVMEWLGLVKPDRSRKDPVAVPAWGPYAVAASLALAGGLIVLLAALFLRSLSS